MTSKFSPPVEISTAERSAASRFFPSLPDRAISDGILFRFPTPGQTNYLSETSEGAYLIFLWSDFAR